MTNERYEEICNKLGFEFDLSNLRAYNTSDAILELKFKLINLLGDKYKLYKSKDSFPGFFSIGSPSFWVDISDQFTISCDTVYKFELNESELPGIVDLIHNHMSTPAL